MSTLTALPGSEPYIGFPFSPLGGMAGVISSYSDTFAFDAANDSICLIFPAPKTGDLFGFEFHLQAGFTGTLRCGFVDISGGAQFPAATPAFSHYSDITNPSSGWQGPASYMGASGGGSGAKKSVTKGVDMICVCISSQAYTSGTGTLTRWNQNAATALWIGSPYMGTSNGGAAWAANFDFPFLSLYYDDGAGNKEAAATPIHPNIQPWNNTITTLTIDSGNPKMAGLKFRFPMEVAIDGAVVYIDQDVDVTPRLIKTGTTTDLITTALMDKDWRRSNTAGPTVIRFADITIEANTWYRLMLENSGSATNVGFYSYDCNDAGDMAAAGAGADFHLTQSNTAFASLTGTDGTDYTDTTTTCPLVAVRLSKVHDGLGGGGGGGIRLAGHGGLAA